MSESTEAFWGGTFGNEYLQRCRVDWQERVPFWRSAVEFCGPATVLEVGCNAGWNLLAIQSIDPTIDCHGVDVNASAVNEARAQGINAEVGSALEIASKYGHESADLVFTAGVLIHVPPSDLERVMRAIIDTSARYVLAIEYQSDKEEEVEYRGHAGKLWRRDFGKLYQDLGLNLRVIMPKVEGFDQCAGWLFEKPGARELTEHEELF